MPTALHWLRRDLRARDNTALRYAAQNAEKIYAAFILDPRWFDPATKKIGPHQAKFLLDSLRELQQSLAKRNIQLIFRTHADPVAALLDIARESKASLITYNKDYEPAQVVQDLRLEHDAARQNITVRPFKDAVFFEEYDILTGAHTPYSVFTPYKAAWLKKFAAAPAPPAGLPRKTQPAKSLSSEKIAAANDLGFPDVQLDIPPGEAAAQKHLATFVAKHLPHYAQTRNLPAHPHSTSRLSAHLSVGTISIRQVLAALPSTSDSPFLTELIWREFYRMILFHHPHTVSQPFNPGYATITWQNNPAHFRAWSTARTGFPIIDAAISQLCSTGFMHNRLRMLTAMFLTKHLDTHWITGERFFMRHLIDYDQASNVGGWQWSASTGTDAAPYFRIMNPILQSQKFDPEGAYIRQHLPQLRNVPAKFIHTPHLMPLAMQRESNCVIGKDYPAPIIDVSQAKQGAIEKFRSRAAR